MSDLSVGESKDSSNAQLTELYALVDIDPKLAVEKARLLIESRPDVAACILVDASTLIPDPSCLEEAIVIFERLSTAYPENGLLAFNMANAYGAQADIIPYTGIDWYMTTMHTQKAARRLFRQAPTLTSDADNNSRSMANLGVRLIKAWRLVEAYDYYQMSLSYDQTNVIALTGAAKILLHYASIGIGDASTLRGVAAKHLRKAKEHADSLQSLAGRRAVEKLMPLIDSNVDGGELPDLTKATPYQMFVARYRLALSPTIEGLDLDIFRWDSLLIESYIEEDEEDEHIPTIFALFNVLKSEYLATRLQAYKSLNSEFEESGNYIDTLDYSKYGVNEAMQTMAQRNAWDLLDKVAVASSQYLCISENIKRINFRDFWFTKDKKKHITGWKKDISDEIERGSNALIALSELAIDVGNDGFLYQLMNRRHTSTHRFTVLLDIGTSQGGSKYYERVSERDFEKQLIETLQIARAALFYFVEMIRQRESHKLPTDAIVGKLYAPDHDSIRGRKNNG